MDPREQQQTKWLTINRITALTDGVFAIVMTLLVLSLEAPEPHEITNIVHLKHLLMNQWHVLYIYFLSFLILANFWIANHSEFSHLKATNIIHLWYSIIFLMFTALLPFTSQLSGDYPHYWLTQGCFHLNMFLISATFLMSWQYASYKRRLIKDNVSDNLLKYIQIRIWVTPIVAILCILLAFFIPNYSSIPYILIPIIHRIIVPKYKKRSIADKE
ncbi:MAG TPA: DUF1211 domain-containing protein [Candidatus Cloacimonetes bacterium]|nr:DUF1211 domain-containing protein [Candidatus Cloacimonadota bacterium]HEX38368.1 DUF1211 domain-containing protein [Candidatus Cloacimonadota bacterium]